MFNLFVKKDMYVYLSESETFKNFNDTNALYWSIKNIDYGNWNIGENNDGIFSYSSQFETTHVILNILFY